MNINTDLLITITTFATKKELTRQHAYRVVKNGSVNSLTIDGITFVIMDDKYHNFTRMRKQRES